MFSGRRARDLKTWLGVEAEAAVSSMDLVRRFAEQCRQTQTSLPGISRIEGLCADALMAAERRIEARITNRLDVGIRERLDGGASKRSATSFRDAGASASAQPTRLCLASQDRLG